MKYQAVFADGGRIEWDVERWPEIWPRLARHAQDVGIIAIEREDVVRVDPREVLTAFVGNVESEAERMDAACHEGCSRAEHLERAFMKVVEEGH